MAGQGIAISFHGPVWTLQPDAVQDALRGSVRELLEEGETRVTGVLTAEIYSHGGAHPERYKVTGHYRRSVNGRMLGSLHGEIHDSNVVYGPWLEGVSARNQSTRFKGYAAFRRSRQQVERLKDGIAAKHVRAALEGR